MNSQMACCCPPKLTGLNVRHADQRHGMCLPLLGSLYDTVTLTPLKCLQTVLGNPSDPRDYVFPTVSAADKEVTKDHCLRNDTTFYVHCPLFTNLAKPRSQSVRSMNIVSAELDVVAGLPAACVLHVGKHVKVGTIGNVAERINEIQRNGHLPAAGYSRVPYHLLLEIAAGQGTELGRDWEELRHLYEGLDYTRVGLCIDTQHAFASGMCEFQTHEDVVKLFDMGNSIATKGISMIHLNDSAKPFRSQVDRHAPLKEGYIWNREDEGLRSLIQISQDIGMDLISETSNPIADNVIIKGYMDGLL